MLQLSITVSVCYVSRDQVIKRTLSSAKTGLFGQRLNAVAKYVQLVRTVSETHIQI